MTDKNPMPGKIVHRVFDFWPFVVNLKTGKVRKCTLREVIDHAKKRKVRVITP